MILISLILIASVFNFTLGIYVWKKNTKNPLNISFGIMSTLLGVWVHVNFLFQLTLHPFLAKSTYFVGTLAAIAGIAWSSYLGYGKLSQRLRMAILTTLAVTTVFSLILYSTDSIVSSVVSGYEIKDGPLFPVYAAYMTALLMAVAVLMFDIYRKSKGLKKMQLRYGLMGGIVFLSFAAMVSFVLPLIGWRKVSVLDSPGSLVFVLCAAYAIVRHRLMDIRVIIKTSVVYSTTVGVITMIFILSVLGFERLFMHYTGYTTLPVAAVAALIIAFAFYPLKNRIQSIVDRYFYKGTYDYQGVLRDASKAMTSILDLEKLLSYILTVLIDSMKIEQGSILLREAKARRFEVKLTASFRGEHKSPTKQPLISKNVLIGYLGRNEEPIVREEMERMLPPSEVRPLSEEMRRFGADVAIPLMRKDRLIGVILLGPKLSGDIYSGEDLQLLSTLANQSAIAIRNAWLYSRLLKDLDTIRDLEREKAKAERLASLGTMAAGIAHEIKNPLVSIKTFAQLLPEKSSDPEFRNVFSQIATKEIDRIDSLVLGLLSLAKPSPPKFELTNVNAVLDETLTPMAVRMQESEIQLEKEYEEDLPQVMADGLQLKQVFSNIFINSIQAIPDGGRIRVITSLHTDSENHGGYVQIEISDTGSGIPQDELDKIFNPFYTTKHEGVGLGLAICHRIIEDHQGNIHLQSQEGLGTTFTISLPLANEEHSSAP